MNFFCTKEHWERWVTKMQVNRDEVFRLDVFEALVVARMLFSEETRPESDANETGIHAFL